MIYQFRDTTQTVEDTGLPAEAVSINGVYIENKIAGYRTLQVSGREILSAEITTKEMSGRNGSMFRGKRLPDRVIEVMYLLQASSAEDFREKYNELNRILNQEQAKIVFYDESDKYFVATKTDVEDPEPGRLSVTGKYHLYCCDPLKYSLTEKEFSAAANEEGVLEATIVNSGTESVPVSYEITHNHDNGYIGIVSEHGAIQLGDVTETDEEVQESSQYLVSYKGGSAFSPMTDGSGIVTEPGKIAVNGSFTTKTAGGQEVLALGSVGSGSYWHGAARQLTIPADSSGQQGAANFKASARIWFETGLVSQTGLLEFVIGDEDGKLLCEMHLVKSTTANNNASCIFKLQGMGDSQNDVKKISFEPNYQNKATNSSGGVIYMEKSGELFTFCFGGKTYSFRAPALKDKKAKTISIFLGQIGSRGAGNLVHHMYFRELSFRSDKVQELVDIPNRYANGSVVTIDGATTKIYTDGVPSQTDEVKGSTYFQAPPGETKVQFYVSDFCTPAPTIKARIREAYL